MSKQTRLGRVLGVDPNILVYKENCPYCENAENMLHGDKIEFRRISFRDDPELVEEVKSSYGHRTYPMIFLGRKFIGGCDSLLEFAKTREYERIKHREPSREDFQKRGRG
jgi:glutaredoxin 3